jgi:hypothetical protein
MSNKLPDELQTLIDNHIKGFNTHDHELFLSVFSDTAIVIDGIAPYRWLNPNGPENWLADVDLWHKKYEVSGENLVFEMGVWAVEGTSAYAVISGTLSVTMKGQSITREGHMTYTFTNYDGTWKIDSQAWARMT